VFWSKKHEEKARAERESIILKASELVKDPKKFTKATSYGAAKYVKNITFDKETKEVVTTGKSLSLDKAKILEDEKYDGYYSVVTSELSMSDQEIVDTYRGLWEIEETFRISKGTIETRPIYISLENRIEAHVLSCFISLVILRLLQKRTGRRFSCSKIIDCLNRVSCSNEQDNIYLFNYRSEISDVISSSMDIDFTKKRLRLNDIKSVLANAKK
jgi:transposase